MNPQSTLRAGARRRGGAVFSTRGPPCEQWLAAAGAGAGSLSVGGGGARGGGSAGLGIGPVGVARAVLGGQW
jgi:hypothetical protein